MTYRNRFAVLLAALCLILTASCKKTEDKDDSVDGKTGISDNLHLSFKTPDWERNIDCTHLELEPDYWHPGVYFVTASSQSTKEAFYFTYPADSSLLVAPSNLKKYAITEFGANDKVFQFSQKLPVTDGSSDRLISRAGFSDNEYVEVSQVKYSGSTSTASIFQIKCRYSMKMAVLSDTSKKKMVSGTFHFKIKTTRK